MNRPLLRSGVPLLLAGLSGLAPLSAEVITVELVFPVGKNLADLGLVNDVRQLELPITNLQDVQARLHISGRGEGGFNGELFASVSHGDKTAILVNRPGLGIGQSFEGYTFLTGYPDEGLLVLLDNGAGDDLRNYRTVATPAAGQPLTGTWLPDARNPIDEPAWELFGSPTPQAPRTQDLSEFDGMDANGTWILTVADHQVGRTEHRVESWSLILTGETTEGLGSRFLPGTRVAAPAFADLDEVGLEGGLLVEGAGPIEFDGTLSLLPQGSIQADTDLVLHGEIEETEGTPGSLTKLGGGVVHLQGQARHNGATSVEEGELRVDGRIVQSVVEIRGAGILGGAGEVAAVELDGGSIMHRIASGSLSSGHQFWKDGTLSFEVKSGTETPPAMRVEGSVFLENRDEEPIRIAVNSLDAGGSAGALEDFDGSTDRRWILVQTRDGIEEYDPAKLELDASGFASELNGGVLSLEVEDGALVLAFTANRAPVLEQVVLLRLPDQAAQLSTTALLASATDPDEDPLTLESVATTSAGGATIVETGGIVEYQPLPGANTPDHFTYSISDGRGGSASAAVQVVVLKADGGLDLAPEVVLQPEDAGNPIVIRFSGAAPGVIYQVQASTTMTPESWETIATPTASPSGLLEFTETDRASHPRRFYRAALQGITP